MQPGMDQPGIASQKGRRVESERRHFLRAIIVQQYVGLFDECEERRARRRGFQIEHQTSLLFRLRPRKHRGHVRLAARTGAARAVAFRRFDLDHIRAEIAEPLTDIGRQQHGTKFENSQPLQR